MLRNKQIDKAWAKESMSIEGDHIEDWGCFLVAIANIIEITPSELNLKFHLNNVYLGRSSKDHESEIDFSKAYLTLGLKFRRVPKEDFFQYNMENIILHIEDKNSPSGQHYVNCLRLETAGVQIFDTYDGTKRVISLSEVKGAYALLK